LEIIQQIIKMALKIERKGRRINNLVSSLDFLPYPIDYMPAAQYHQ
jgi:hypothetical protein